MKVPLKKKGIAFSRAYTRVLRDPRIKIQDKGFYSLIKSYANADGSHCFPSIELLQSCMGCDVKTVYACLKRLKGHGILSVVKQNRHNLYLLNDENWAKHVARPASRPTEKRKTSSGKTPPKKRETTKIHNQEGHESAVVREEPATIIPFRKQA